jgi:hypothetical protein
MGDKRNAYMVLVVKFEGKRSLGRPRRGWKNTINRDVEKKRMGVLEFD